MGECRDCGRGVWVNCRSGYCRRCRRRRQCSVCYRTQTVPRPYCEECQALLDLIGSLPRGARPPRPLRRVLVREYRRRAQMGLPLFQEAG